MVKKEVGYSAGIIWHLLSERGALSVRKIGEMTNYSESIIFMALGWLAREDKVRFLERSGKLCVELSVPVTEKYY